MTEIAMTRGIIVTVGMIQFVAMILIAGRRTFTQRPASLGYNPLADTVTFVAALAEALMLYK